MLLYLGMERELLVVDPDSPEEAVAILAGKHIAALSVDPAEPERIFCATYSEGLLRSLDGGNTWARVGEDVIESKRVLSVATSPANPDVVFAGTEPSAMYRSDDGGDTWRALPTFQDLPSRDHWSFPPKPETHHVRWIMPHPKNEQQLFVAVEAGALVQSQDGGNSWEDRVPGGPIDTHTMAIHPERPDRLLSAAGDGFFISDDRGRTWTTSEDGLAYRYCYGLAVDAQDPDVVVMSVSPGAHRGHGSRERARASIVRRERNGSWEVTTQGLPEPDGTTLSILASVPGESGAFYALNNTGLYYSGNGGRQWQRLDVPWKDEYLDRRPPALAVGAAPWLS